MQNMQNIRNVKSMYLHENSTIRGNNTRYLFHHLFYVRDTGMCKIIIGPFITEFVDVINNRYAVLIPNLNPRTRGWKHKRWWRDELTLNHPPVIVESTNYAKRGITRILALISDAFSTHSHASLSNEPSSRIKFSSEPANSIHGINFQGFSRLVPINFLHTLGDAHVIRHALLTNFHERFRRQPPFHLLFFPFFFFLGSSCFFFSFFFLGLLTAFRERGN